jgi:hypothetical protein
MLVLQAVHPGFPTFAFALRTSGQRKAGRAAKTAGLMIIFRATTNKLPYGSHLRMVV